MSVALRQATLTLYLNPANVIHQHLGPITDHSLRVFICLYLELAGWEVDSIAHQLHWNFDMIKFYIRQSLFKADKVGVSLSKSALAIG